MRLLLITVIAALITGCPKTFTAIVKNESDQTLTKFYYCSPGNKCAIEVIKPRQSKKTQWGRDCNYFEIDGEERLFVSPLYPGEAIIDHWFGWDERLGVVYKDNKLYFQGKDGALTEIMESDKCY